MTVDTEARTVSSATDLLEVCSLDDVVYYEIRAVVVDGGTRVAQDDEPRPLLVTVRQDADRMEVRCRLELELGDVTIHVDAASRFDFAEPVTITTEARDQFVSRVGVMAVYPYLREAAHQAAAKLRVTPPVLGIARSGRFDPLPATDDANSVDGP